VRCGHHGPDRIDDAHTPDILAFLLVVYRARKSRVPGLKFSTLLDTIAKDSTSWFMLVFTSHLVLVMTLSLGRVSLVSRFSELQQMTSALGPSSQVSSFFQPRKSSSPYRNHNHPHRGFLCHDQRSSRVSLTAGSHASRPNDQRTVVGISP
jgi:hypothetical protein